MKNFTLDNHPKIETGFKIPENYFENFSDKLMENLPKKETKIISIYNRKSLFYAAAAVILLFISIPVTNSYFNNKNEVDDEQIENYLASNNSISDADIASIYENEEDLKMQTNVNLEDETIENELIKNKDLEQYLTE